jgi:hypothetical protein
VEVEVKIEHKFLLLFKDLSVRENVMSDLLGENMAVRGVDLFIFGPDVHADDSNEVDISTFYHNALLSLQNKVFIKQLLSERDSFLVHLEDMSDFSDPIHHFRPYFRLNFVLSQGVQGSG